MFCIVFLCIYFFIYFFRNDSKKAKERKSTLKQTAENHLPVTVVPIGERETETEEDKDKDDEGGDNDVKGITDIVLTTD